MPVLTLPTPAFRTSDERPPSPGSGSGLSLTSRTHARRTGSSACIADSHRWVPLLVSYRVSSLPPAAFFSYALTRSGAGVFCLSCSLLRARAIRRHSRVCVAKLHAVPGVLSAGEHVLLLPEHLCLREVTPEHFLQQRPIYHKLKLMVSLDCTLSL